MKNDWKNMGVEKKIKQIPYAILITLVIFIVAKLFYDLVLLP